MAAQRCILYCDCAHTQLVDQADKSALLAALGACDADVEVVSDLCELAAGGDPRLAELAAAEELIIVACYARAVKWLFAAAGVPLDADRVTILNMRVMPVGDIIAALPGDLSAGHLDIEPISPPTKGDWAPWFPVIDRDRCTNCQKCLQFCLFGAFDLSDDGRVEVTRPANCKTNCPACARVCPAAAIIFPKYSSAPINGAEVSGDFAQPVQVDLAAIAGGDVLAALRKRGKRFAIDDDSARDQAARRLAELQSQLDIPPEVLRDIACGGACKCKCDEEETPADDTQAAPKPSRE